MKHSNNWKKKIVILLYKSVSMLLAFSSSIALWYWNISPYWSEGYKGYTTLVLVGLLYCMVYWISAKTYRAVKIGIYRFTDLAYFQFLSFGLSDIVLFIESMVWFHNLERLRIGTYFVVLVIQMFIIAVSKDTASYLFIYGLGEGRRTVM